jgi:hypothetical protein
VPRDIEGLPTQEAAEVAGIGQAAVKSRLHQARLGSAPPSATMPWSPPAASPVHGRGPRRLRGPGMGPGARMGRLPVVT